MRLRNRLIKIMHVFNTWEKLDVTTVEVADEIMKAPEVQELIRKACVLDKLRAVVIGSCETCKVSTECDENTHPCVTIKHLLFILEEE